MTYKLSTSKTTKTHSYVSFLFYYLALSTIRPRALNILPVLVLQDLLQNIGYNNSIWFT